MRRRTTIAALALAALSAPAATARDLPRGVPAHPPTGCESFGADFHKIEGTDTCIRISGSVRLETSVTTGGRSSFWSPRR